MKVLHIQLYPLLSGVQNVSIQEIKLLKEKVQYHVIMKESGPFSDQLCELNVPVYYVKNLTRSINPIQDFISLLKIIKWIRRINPDIVHVHSAKTGFLGRVASRILKKKVIYTVHGWPMNASLPSVTNRLYSLLESLLSNITDATICLSKRDVQIGRALNKRSNILYIPNGVDLVKYKPCREKRRHPKVQLLFMGRFDKQKDPIFFLKGLNELRNQDVFSVKIIGGGGLQAEVQKSVSSLVDRGYNISLNSWSDRPDLELREADVFVMTSLYEGMPLALLEAMATGLICIVPSLLEFSELIENNENGLVYDAGNINSLKDTLLKVTTNIELYRFLGENARVKVQQEFNIDKRVAEIMKHYSSYDY